MCNSEVATWAPDRRSKARTWSYIGDEEQVISKRHPLGSVEGKCFRGAVDPTQFDDLALGRDTTDESVVVGFGRISIDVGHEAKVSHRIVSDDLRLREAADHDDAISIGHLCAVAG